LAEGLQVGGGALGFGVEHGVSAAHVHEYRMFHRVSVAQGDPMRLTGASAVAVVAARRQIVGVHAVFRVIERKVLVQGHLEGAGVHPGANVEQLRDVQVV
jgi:hypothetical protein